MCMKNLNANILTCADAKKSSTNNMLTYSDIFDVIVPEIDFDNSLYISNIDIVVDLIAVFSDKEEDAAILMNKEYECLLATTFDGNKFTGIGKFKFSVDEDELLACGARKFLNKTILFNNQRINLRENASYCDLVLLIKYPPETDEAKWIFQTAKRLFINRI